LIETKSVAIEKAAERARRLRVCIGRSALDLRKSVEKPEERLEGQGVQENFVINPIARRAQPDLPTVE
jgi:hypothetical protein